MPQLLVFAPCEKVIFAQGENTPTLIALLGTITLSDPPSGMAPETVGPIRWAIFSQWTRQQTDGQDTFEQRIRLERDDGTVLLEHIASFSMTGRVHRIAARAGGFPVGAPGTVTLRLWLRNSTRDDDWGDSLATFPIEVVHARGSAEETENVQH
jgi:hypothetical protein